MANAFDGKVKEIQLIAAGEHVGKTDRKYLNVRAGIAKMSGLEWRKCRNGNHMWLEKPKERITS